jgi:hypothetical protein
MNSQNLILLGSGLFVAIIVAFLAYDEFQQREHRPTEPQGLIWQVNTAFDRIRDLEMVIEIDAPAANGARHGTLAPALASTEAATDSTPTALASPVQILVRYINDGQPAVSLRFPVEDGDTTNDELLVVDGGRLSHFLPEENTTITRFGLARLSLVQLALSMFRLGDVDAVCREESVELSVEQDMAGPPADLFAPALRLQTSLSGEPTGNGGLCLDPLRCAASTDWSYVALEDPMVQSPIQGGYVLKVADEDSGTLRAMIWIDQNDYTVRKTVYYVDGQRAYSQRVLRIELNPGLTREDVVALPRGAMEIEG